MYWCALISVILQLAVLIFSALKSQALKTGGTKPARYAYPFTASGTILLVVGMLICSHVVEQRSIEEVFQTQSSQGYICWLQRGEEVEGQQFDSFAIFARGPRDSIRTSRLIKFSKVASEHEPQGGLFRSLVRLGRVWKNSKDFATNPTVSSHHFVYEVIATMGCLTSIIGFISQFIGLRGLHWSATVAQLAATLIMTGVRAWVRRDLTIRPRAQRLYLNHELDWIATRIVSDYERLWSDTDDNDEQTSKDEAYGFWEPNCWNWGIVSGKSADAYNLLSTAPQVSTSLSVVTVRKRLGSLSNWSGPLSDLAISVATVIETVMNSLCSFSEESYQRAESLYWSVNSGANGKDDSNNKQIYLKLNKIGPNGPWKADAVEIEAVLSLWLYSVQHKDRSFTSLDNPKGNRYLMTEKDWLHYGTKAVRQDSMRFLGQCLPSTCRDLIWYMASQASRISIVRAQIKSGEPESDEDSGGADLISVENHRVVGFRDTPNIHETNFPVTSVAPFKRNMYELWMSGRLVNAFSKLDGTGSLSDIDDLTIPSDELAVFPDHDLKLLFAQDLFSTFMWNIAKKMNPVDGKTILHPTEGGIISDAPSWMNFRLENSKLNVALHAFQKAKLGTFEDACLCVIPPLSRAGKLPDASPVIEHVQKLAKELEVAGRMEEVGSMYISLFQVGKTFHSQQSFSLKTMGILSEFWAFIHNTAKATEVQLRDFPFIDPA